MVGEGVLYTCLQDETVSEVLVLGRRPCGHSHPKMKEVLRQDFFNFDDISSEFARYDACFFCLGISSVGVKEPKYTRITYDLTMAFAHAFHQANPKSCFCYVSGAGTDSTESGRSMWARVKGKTENDIIALFDHGYAFRPGYIQPIPGMQHTYTIYKVLGPLYPLWKLILPSNTCTLSDLGQSMLCAATGSPNSNVLNSNAITELAKQYRSQNA